LSPASPKTATGIGGPPIALVYISTTRRPFCDRTIALCFLIGEVISLALAAAGKTNTAQLGSAVLLVPAPVVGAAVCRLIHQRVKGRGLRVFVPLLAIASGAMVLLRMR